MKALVYEAPRVMNVREVELPVLTDDEVLIEVSYSGICGSELSGYLGHNSLRYPPVVFGHEFSGKIAQIGGNVSQFQVGQRVTANPLVTCGSCTYCKRGQQQLCVNRQLLSASLPGSNAEFVKIPARFVYPLPDHLTLEQGALTEPVACAVRVADLADLSPTQSVLVMGMGPIGQLVTQVLLNHGLKNIIVADMNLHRLEQAKALGAHVVYPKEQNVVEEVKRITDGLGVEAAIDAVGASITRNQCVAAAAAGGKVIFTGLHEADSTLPINHIIRSEIHLIGSFAYSSLNFETALKLLDDGRIGFTDGVVKAPFSDGAEWFETLANGGGNVTKVLLDPRL